MFLTVADGSSVRGSVSGEEEWSEDMEEPEMEFDEMGLELAAQDGKLHFYILLIKIKEHSTRAEAEIFIATHCSIFQQK